MCSGEVSGDRQAAHLARTLLLLNSSIRLYGCGGTQMESAGVDIKIKTAHLGYVGFQESFRFTRPLKNALDQIAKMIQEERPDMAVLIDSEHFNRSVAKLLTRHQIPFIYYFPPQVWLWGKWRARSVAKQSRMIIPAFSEEVDIYRAKGGRVQWCGHPLLDLVKPEKDHARIFVESGLNPTLQTIGILPGSRYQELEELGPSMLAAARQIKERHPKVQFILPLAAPHLLPALQRQIGEALMTEHVKIITSHVYTCLSRCDVVMLSSGTATLEAALLGVPMVVGYRVTPLTYLVARQIVSTKYVAMPNILLSERVIPELIQKDFSVKRLVAETLDIFENKSRAQMIRNRLRQIPSMLGTEGAIARAATLILNEASSTVALTCAHQGAQHASP
ncbi:lipid-A-disaccharide synthase [Pedosphaera parvula Ellin514]|uniref:Lipid-A-disaccharide synthase n=2 Tax=Pedosphaera TaxID=1032526 RepID=B9XGH3_PEDPL|nr:lipid-A-disaccharide synthase [Pedosphaera parvula Ellin514]